MIIPLGISFLLSGYLFFNYEFTKPSLWIAFYSGFTKNIWGLLVVTFIFGLASGMGLTIRDFLSMEIFRLMGRSTFCVYLVHTLMIRITMGYLRTPPDINDVGCMLQGVSLFFMSYMVGTLLSIFVEIPFFNLQKTVMDLAFPRREDKEQGEADVNNDGCDENRENNKAEPVTVAVEVIELEKKINENTTLKS